MDGFYIDPIQVEAYLDEIDRHILSIESVLRSIDSDISSGWLGAGGSYVGEKITAVKNTIQNTKEHVYNVRQVVQEYEESSKKADASIVGNITAANSNNG